MDTRKLKEQCICLFLQGKNVSEIAKLTGWSRTYVYNLIKNDKRFIESKNKKEVKVYKRKDNNQFSIYIPSIFLEKLGISHDTDKTEYVDLSYDEKSKSIIIKKHS